MELERKYIINPGEYLKPGSHTYIAIRLSDWKRICHKLGEDI